MWYKDLQIKFLLSHNAFLTLVFVGKNINRFIKQRQSEISIPINSMIIHCTSIWKLRMNKSVLVLYMYHKSLLLFARKERRESLAYSWLALLRSLSRCTRWSSFLILNNFFHGTVMLLKKGCPESIRSLSLSLSRSHYYFADVDCWRTHLRIRIQGGPWWTYYTYETSKIRGKKRLLQVGLIHVQPKNSK